ncbi:MAG: hypothetical protein R3B72_27145 [Polyangiaceae bacterium]
MASVVVALLAACGGTTVVDGGDGASDASSGSTSSGGGASSTSTGSSSSTGGESPWVAFCAAATATPGLNCADDAARCEASEACEDNLRYGPGSPLFDCIAADSCDNCLIEAYDTSTFTPAGLELADACGSATAEGCGIFEDLCFAGALFTDAYLDQMLACYALPSCPAIESCVLDLYGPCVGWVYAKSF